MKKFNLLLSLLILSIFAIGQNSIWLSDTTCLIVRPADSTNFYVPTVDGIGVGGDVTLEVSFRGDYDGGGEYLDVIDEDNNQLMRLTRPGFCPPDFDSSNTYLIPRADFVRWMNDDDTIKFRGLAGTEVDNCGALNPACSQAIYKFTFLTVEGTANAGVTEIITDESFCEGTQDVSANIGNFGFNQIDSVDVNWEVNGVAQPTLSFKSLLDTVDGSFSSDTIVLLGSASLDSGMNTIKVYTSLPNGVADTVNNNDTLVLELNSASPPLNTVIRNILTTSVDVVSEELSGNIDFEYDVAPFGIGDIGTGNTGSSSAGTFPLTGLTPGTDYQLYVRSNCGNGDTTDWQGPFNFTTSFEVPFLQDFELFVDQRSNPLREGWTNEAANGLVLVPRWMGERASGFNQGGPDSGPLFDHTNDGVAGGTHMVFNSWLAPFGQNIEGTVTSPPIFISVAQNKVKLSYWYHMWGPNTGVLEVILDTNGVEEILATYTGVQQSSQADDWLLAEHFLDGYAGKSISVKFRSYGIQTRHRPAIDDVAVDTITDVSTSVVEVLEPSGALCPGSLTARVVVRNTGINDITSFDVVSDVNGTLDTTSHTRTISTGDTAHVDISTLSFTAGILYDMSFYTINPNGVADENTLDDTLTLETITTGLAGDISIDASAPVSGTNFQTFRALSNRLNAVGVCGDVNVYVAPGNYIGDYLSFDNVQGLSDVNQLTIDGDSATDTRDSVMLRNTGTASNGAFVFHRTSYVTIKNMTVEGRYSGFQDEYGAHFSNRSNHNVLDNIFFDMDPVNFNVIGLGASADITNEFSTNSVSNANYNEFRNLEIEGGDISVRFMGPSNPQFGFNTGNQFIDCNFYNWDGNGIFMNNSDSTVIHGDSIHSGRNNFFQRGIDMTNAMNFRISNNYINVREEAIRIWEANSVVNPELNAEIYNNMAVVTNSTGSFQPAVYLRNPLRIDMWYNSFFTDEVNGEDLVHFDGISLIDSLDVRNNIFATFDNLALRMNGTDDTLAFLRFDNNVFYRENGNPLLDVNGNSYNSLSAYQSATPRFNVSSVEDDPQFNSLTDLHIIGLVPSDIADNSVPVLEDIDGDVRPSVNALFADIGADEYGPPTCPPPNGLSIEFIRADSVRITWKSKSLGTRVQYEYDLDPFVIGNGNVGLSTNDTALIGGLSENTTYSIAIRQVCSRGDTSRYTKQTLFTTPCFPKQAGYYTDFEDDELNEPPACWTQYYEFDNQVYSEVRAFPNVLGTRSLVISTWFQFSPIDTAMAISPVMDSMTNGDYRIKFQTNSEATANALIVGTTPLPNGIGGFNPIDTIQHAAPIAWEDHIVDITTANGYNGTDQHLAFINTGNSAGIDEIKIDDFLYEEIPSCLEPRFPSLDYLGSDSIIFNWEDFAGATEWQIEYGFAGFNQSTGNIYETNNHPDTITDLLPNTDYEIYVRAICVPGDSSAWTRVFAFTTECIADSVDIFENWDANNTGETPDCWMEYLTGSAVTDPHSFAEVTAGVAFSGNNTLQLGTWFGDPGDTVAIFSNRYGDMTEGDKRIRFQASTSDGTLVQDLKVFTTDTRGPGANWTEMEHITFNNVNTYEEEYIVDLTTANGYNGTDQYIAFLPGLVFNDEVRIDDYYYEDIPSCPRARNLQAIPGTDTAVVFWDNTSPSDTIMVAYSLAPFDSATAVYDTIVGNRDTLRGLVGGSFYEYAVAIICAPGDTSVASATFQFQTECIPYNYPYFTNFDDGRDDEPYVCWQQHQAAGPFMNLDFFNADVHFFEGRNGTPGLVVNGWNGTNVRPDTLGAITPEFVGMPAGDKRLRFFAQTSNTNTTLLIHTGTRPDEFATYSTPFDTITFDRVNEWKQYYVDITTDNGYNGTDSVIIMRHDLQNTFTQVFIDDFHYEEIPSCLAPREPSTSGIDPDSASLSWDDFATGVTEWQVEWDTAFTDGLAGTGDTIIVTSNPAPLTGLIPNSLYGYRVRAICAPGDTSFWTPVHQFETPCEPFMAPYFTDYANDVVGQMPECWIEYATYQPNFQKTQVIGGGGNIFSNPNALELNSWFGFTLGQDTLLTVTPKFSDITEGDKRLRFHAATNQANILNEIWIWSADGPDPGTANINIIDTLTFQNTNAFEEFIVNLDTGAGKRYNGTDEYLYIVHGIRGFGAVDISIDDFHYEEIPSCLRVTDVSHLHFDADSTELSWTDPSGAIEFIIEYGLKGFIPGTGDTVIATTNKDTIYDLLPSSYYEAYITAVCDTSAANGDTSFTLLYEFESLCGTLPSPYSTSFEEVPDDSIPLCWTEHEIIVNPPFNEELFGVEIEGFFNSANTGEHGLVFNHWNGDNTNGDTLVVVTPPMDSLTNGDHRLIFWASNSDFGLDNRLIVGTMSDPDLLQTRSVMDTLTFTTQNAWQEFEVRFTADSGYNGTDEYIYIEQELVGGDANFTEIRTDDYVYEKIPTCWPPIAMNAQFIGADSAYLAWTDDSVNANTATQWELEFGRKGFELGTGTRVIVTSNPHLVDTLQSETGYDFYVRPICSIEDTSTWPEVPGSFFTNCDLAITQGAVLPWIENWDSVAHRTQIGDAFVICDSTYQWLFNTDDQGFGRIRTGDSSLTWHSANGKAVTMDRSQPGGAADSVENQLILTIDLESYKPYGDLELKFSAMHHGEEANDGDWISIRGWEGDPWINIAYVPNVVGFGNWTRHTFDIDSLLATQGQMVSHTFQVRFGQEDNFDAQSINTFDGLSIDSISITGGTVVVQPVTVEEIADRVNGISIYPNPSTGLFIIDITSEEIETYNVTVRDIKGQIVYEEIANVNGKYRKDVDFTGFAKGVYFMQVQSENNSYVEKLVIQ